MSTDRQLGDGDRVALKRNPEYTGRVQGRVIDGCAYVRFDQGGGANFSLGSLIPLGQPEDKTWPPSGIETK